MSHQSPSPEQRERELSLRRELESLGEPPPSAEELELFEQELDDDPDVATVNRLVELAGASGRSEALSELELHRTWRTVEQRAAAKRPIEPMKPAGARRWWLAAAGGLAVAAGVMFVVLGPDPDEARDAGPSLEQVTEMGEQVHATLRMLDDGKSDTERATELAAEYQRRLAREEQDG